MVVLPPLSCQFALSLSFVSMSKSYQKVLMYPGWEHTMNDEMDALISCQTWDLMSFIWNVVVVEVGFQKFYSDHFVFIRKTSSGTIIFVYVIDILLTGSDVDSIKEAKEYLKTQLVTKDMGRPRTFLGLKLLTVDMK